MERFAGVTEPVGPYNPKIGLTLAYDVNHWVSRFEAGFYHITVSH
jgi:hypothetical protein